MEQTARALNTVCRLWQERRRRSSDLQHVASVIRYHQSAHFGRLLAEFLGLFGQGGQLALDELGLQRSHFLGILGVQELLGEFKQGRHIALGKFHRQLASAFGADLHGLHLGFGGADGMLGGGDKAVKSLFSLGHAFFREFAHFRGNFEFHIFRHNYLLEGKACDAATIHNHFLRSVYDGDPVAPVKKQQSNSAVKDTAAWRCRIAAAAWTLCPPQPY